ncbi:MAG: ComEA family DNA-binding protein [Herpetosiphon sp.]
MANLAAWVTRHRLPLAAVLLVGLAFAGGWWQRRVRDGGAATAPPSVTQRVDDAGDERRTVVPITATIGVDVVGAVRTPGLYFLPLGARTEDAVKAAGGMMPSANRDAINLSARLADAQQVRVPRVGDVPTVLPTAAKAVGGKSLHVVNVNTADAAALSSLPGVGPALAQRIVDYRTAKGAFHSLADLERVKGFGHALGDKLKDSLRFTD